LVLHQDVGKSLFTENGGIMEKIKGAVAAAPQKLTARLILAISLFLSTVSTATSALAIDIVFALSLRRYAR
jgi:hypothetical protein